MAQKFCVTNSRVSDRQTDSQSSPKHSSANTKTGRSTCALKRQLGPVRILLLLCGVGRLKTTTNRPARIAYVGYTIAVLLTLIFMPIRLIWQSDWSKMFDERNAAKISLISWSAQTMFAAISCIYTQSRCRHVQLWRLLAEIDSESMLNQAGRQPRVDRVMTAMNVLGALYLLLNTVNVLPLFGVGQNLYPDDMFFVAESNYILAGVINLMLIPWIAQQVIYSMVCYYLTQVWTSFGAIFYAKGRRDQDEPFERIVEWGFVLSRQLKRVTAHIDGMFQGYALTQLALVVPTFIWQLYIVVVLDADPFMKLILASWVVCNFLQILVICAAAFVNTAAADAREAFLDVYVDRIHRKRELDHRSDQLIHLQTADTLLSTLHAQDTGVTMCDLTMQNKAFFLTVISVVCNYFFLLLQFAQQKPDDPNFNTTSSYNQTTQILQ